MMYFVHVTPYAKDLGFSDQQASLQLSLLGVSPSSSSGQWPATPNRMSCHLGLRTLGR